jgi:uncharacterized protein
MTPQEEVMLNDLIGRVEQTQLAEKDPEAEQLLNQSLARNPDALYILAQTVLVQKYALEQATAQLEQLRRQPATQPAHSTSFLGNLLNRFDPAPPPTPPPPPPGYGAPPAGQAWNTVPSYGPPPVPPAYGGGGGGGSSFLRSAATTAAGVAAGAFAFQGIESLLHGFGHQGGFGGGGYFGGGGQEEIINNNYYGDSGREAGESHHLSDSNLGNSSGDTSLADDLTSQDDLSLDDTSYDDSSSGDDSYDDSSSSDDLA